LTAVSQVRVWDLEDLTCEHALQQPAGTGGVHALLAVEGAMWAAVRGGVVLWGR
jgi:hypothetical protein